jgi:hypothetical protein
MNSQLLDSRRDDAVTQFWSEVRSKLQRDYRRDRDQADLGIGKYRMDTERRKLGETVFNQGVDRTAEVVNGVIENGLPEASF